MEHSCAKCANSIYCPTWTETKCKVFSRRDVYDPDEHNECEHFEKKKFGEEPVCHCDDCETQVREDMK